jgi:hypothetical protein
MGCIDDDIQKMYDRILSADDNTLPIDERIMKRNRIRADKWYKDTFNDDAEAVRDENGNIFAYKGPSFKQS